MRRALLTKTERERLAGETDVSEQRIYESISRARRRIDEEMPTDVAILREYQPELYEELRTAVCENVESPEIDR